MKQAPSTFLAGAATLTFLASSAVAQTTALPFDGISPTDLLQGYGDRVDGPMSGGFSYGGSGTYTPNVLLSYGGESGTGIPRYLSTWALGYNDLVNVIFLSSNDGGKIQITLTADPGFSVGLDAFDIGNWGAAIVLPSVRVLDESGAVLFEELNVPLNASVSPLEKNYVFAPAPTGRILTLLVDLDGLGANAANVGIDNIQYTQQAATPIHLGTDYCGPAAANSSTGPATIRAWGSETASDNDFTVVATGMPNLQFGYFLTSKTAGFIPNPGGSQGNLCVAGQIVRFAGTVLNTGVSGNFELDVDLTNLPAPASAILSGETWRFQGWFRDENPTPTSNFTDGLEVAFL